MAAIASPRHLSSQSVVPCSSASLRGSRRAQSVRYPFHRVFVARPEHRRVSGGIGGRSPGSCRCVCAEVRVPDASASESEQSLYGLLGVGRDVSLSEIKSAYRQMALRYHPDVCPANEREVCTQKFLEVQCAYEILSNPEQKAAYDYELLHPLFAKALEKGASFGRRRTQGSHGVSEAWKMQWEAQLSRLRYQTSTPESWGARMRRQSQL